MAKIYWTIDPAHSTVQYNIEHLKIVTLSGSFNEISGTVEADENFENAKFTFEANISSIDTNDEKRDAHLKSSEFFDAEKFPKMTFVSTNITQKYENIFELKGDLTIRGTTKPVQLDVMYRGMATDPWGTLKAGFELRGAINRKDFGLMWNAQIETGDFMLGDEVKIIANIEFQKKVA